MDANLEHQIVKELQQMKAHIEEMKKDTNYQLRRIATRLEEMNK